MNREFAFPGTRPKWAPDRVVDIQHIALELEVDPALRTIAGTATLRAVVLASDTRAIELDAVELAIEKVSVGGAPAGFRHDGARLRIELPGPSATGSELVIAIAYHGAPRRGLYFIAPDEAYPGKPLQVWSQGQDEDARYWVPCFDTPNEKATSELKVTVPANLFALSNGVLVSDRVDGGRRTLHWRLDVPHSSYLITLAIGDFAAIETRWRDVPVVYYVERGREAAAERTLARTPEMLELFSRLFGVPYPYPRYAQVFVADFIFGGMENTTATTLTDTVLLDERAALDHDMDALVAHELAHQWFGDLVTCRDWGEGWLNEGFATYSEYVWREHHEGRDAADLELDAWAERYFTEDSGRYRRRIATKHYEEPIDIFDHHLYEKGGRVLHMLRDAVGDGAFWRAVAHYLGKHRHGVVESRDLARAVEEATGKNVDWFFSQWVIDGAGHPELEVAIRWDAGERIASVTVEQKHKVDEHTPLFRITTRVRFRVGDADHDVPIDIVDPRHVFHVRLDAEPSQAIFDPGRIVVAQLKVDKPEPVWIAELAGATLAIDRATAAAALARRGGPAAERALGDALERDRFWGVRGAAALGLATLRTPAARDRLIKALAAEVHARARRAIARALGEFIQDAAAGAALAAVVERGDASYFVEAEAVLALGKTRTARAGELCRVAATRESFSDVIRQHAYRGLAEARDDSALGLLVDGIRWGRLGQGRRAAAMALAQLMRGRRDREARDVRERLELLLADRDFRVQAAAIEALAVVGDPAAIAALRRMVDRELDGRLRRRGKEVIRDLESATQVTEDVRRMRDEIGELRSLTTSLRERLERIEASARGEKAGGKKAPDNKRDKKRDKKRDEHPDGGRGKDKAKRKNKNR
ncbi:MAG TPA: M1 family metallopeptidase [Kofleriaceae bacterium]|nr:M1 family metallopeptidase [Kofleriaceae bacterium]